MKPTLAWIALSCLLLQSSISSSGGNSTSRPKVSSWKTPHNNDVNDVAHFNNFKDPYSSTPLPSSESIISQFLSSSKGTKDRFHIQGWRWHTLSLVRDTRRLEKLALKLLHQSSSSTSLEELGLPPDALEMAAKHVVDFNMKGLHRIENELFFPWLRTKLKNMPSSSSGGSGSAMEDVAVGGSGSSEENGVDNYVNKSQGVSSLGDALGNVLSLIEVERESVFKLGKAVREQARIASLPSTPDTKRIEALSNVANMAAALSSRTRGIMDKEETLLIPSVAALIPEKEQKSFNNKVIRKLGLLDSRLHLVGMYDAVWETNNPVEKDLFQECIPYLPRMMIPRWRRTLYEPQAGVLEKYNTP